MLKQAEYSFVLYLRKEAAYSAKVDGILGLLKEAQRKWQIAYSLIEADEMKASDVKKFGSEIHSIMPQARGRIVSSKGFVLPLSGSKNPNLENTPVLILYENNESVNVFPHLLGTTYFGIEEALQSILKFGPKDYLGSKGLLENPVVKIVSNHPTILELGMKFMDANVGTGAGEIDLVLQDGEGHYAVVEAETIADDFAVGQVCRLAASYAEKVKSPLKDIRRLIVCIGYDKNVQKTCEGANVELFQMTSKRLK